MEKYLGVKIISAKPMNRKEYNDYRGWELPSDENGSDEGMLVEYEDGGQSNHPDHKGYISWSPRYVFEKAYQPITGMSFGFAIEALKLGKKVARTGWNGKVLFVFMQVQSEINEEIVPKMQSLPQSVKDEFVKRGGNISYSNQMAIVKPDNSINGWAPSVSDVLAEDWLIVE